MTQEERKSIMYAQGRANALALQEKAPDMTGTELNAADGDIPSFTAAVANKNMLERKAGFVCRSSAGRVVRLVQPYDSTIYTQEPEELPAQWGFAWSTDPAKALPFVAMSTAPIIRATAARRAVKCTAPRWTIMYGHRPHTLRVGKR